MPQPRKRANDFLAVTKSIDRLRSVYAMKKNEAERIIISALSNGSFPDIRIPTNKTTATMKAIGWTSLDNGNGERYGNETKRNSSQ